MEVSKEIVEDVLVYLCKVYGDDGELNIGNNRSSVTPFGQKMPLVGRNHLLESTKQLYDERASRRHIAERHSHPVGVIGGCSGLGKTRGLVAIGERIHEWKSKNQWHAIVNISYNNGNPPTCDRSLFGLSDTKPAMEVANTAFGLRVLYFAFVCGLQPRVSFENFAREFPRDLLSYLTTSIAISAICSFCETKYNLPDGVLFIGVDEINYLLDETFQGVNGKEQQYRGFLKATMIAFGSSLISSSAGFVFGIVAGTTVLPLDKVFAESGHPVLKLPIGLLSGDDCELLMDSLEKNSPAVWGNWRTCRAFRTVLSDFGSLPRLAEQFLQKVEEKIETAGEPLMNIDYETLYSILLSSLTIDAHILARYGSTLISVVMLSTSVSRGQYACSASISEDGESDTRLTFGALEEQGIIVLKTTSEQQCVVQLPYPVFRSVIGCLNGRDPLVHALRRMCSIGNPTVSLSWQGFEDLFVHMEAVREMLLARSLEEDKSCFANSFYCVQQGHASAVDEYLEFALREYCSINTVSTSFPSNAWATDGDEQGTGDLVNTDTEIIKNAPGAIVDSFTCRSQYDGSRIFCFGQQKYYQDGVVPRDLINSEHLKVHQRMGMANDGAGVPYILVVAATRVADDVLEYIPDGCIMLTGACLENFFGPIFSGRFRLIADMPKVNINTANVGEIKTLPGIGNTLAKMILVKRAELAFSCWEDLKSRVRRIPKKLEPCVQF